MPTDPKELRKLLERAQKGDESTLPILHEILRKLNWLEACGKLAKHAENALIGGGPRSPIAVRHAEQVNIGPVRISVDNPFVPTSSGEPMNKAEIEDR